MSTDDTPAPAEPEDDATPPAEGGRSATMRRVLTAAGVVVVVGAIGTVGWVAASDPAYRLDEPRPGQQVTAEQPLKAAGTTGEVGDDAIYTLAVQPGAGGRDVYTVGEAGVIADGSWAGSVSPPASRPDAAVSVVVVRADALCGRQLAAMSDPGQGSERFYGPLPPGCTVLSTVPVQSR